MDDSHINSLSTPQSVPIIVLSQTIPTGDAPELRQDIRSRRLLLTNQWLDLVSKNQRPKSLQTCAIPQRGGGGEANIDFPSKYLLADNLNLTKKLRKYFKPSMVHHFSGKLCVCVCALECSSTLNPIRFRPAPHTHRCCWVLIRIRWAPWSRASSKGYVFECLVTRSQKIVPATIPGLRLNLPPKRWGSTKMEITNYILLLGSCVKVCEWRCVWCCCCVFH